MSYKLVKDMFPKYLEEENIIIEKDKSLIYFSSKRIWNRQKNSSKIYKSC